MEHNNSIIHFQETRVIKIITSDDVEKLPLEVAAAKEVYYSARAKKYYKQIPTVYSISNNAITMERIYGQTIREYIKLYPENYSILVENVIGIIKTLIRAGVSHNDLNIDNLIIDKEGYIWAIDFGYAKEICQIDNVLEKNLDVFIISVNDYLTEINLDDVIPEKYRYKWEYNEDGDYVLIKPDP